MRTGSAPFPLGSYKSANRRATYRIFLQRMEEKRGGEKEKEIIFRVSGEKTYAIFHLWVKWGNWIFKYSRAQEKEKKKEEIIFIVDGEKTYRTFY